MKTSDGDAVGALMETLAAFLVKERQEGLRSVAEPHLARQERLGSVPAPPQQKYIFFFEGGIWLFTQWVKTPAIR